MDWLKPSRARTAFAAMTALVTCTAVAGCGQREVETTATTPASALDPEQTAGEAAYLAPPAVVQVRPGDAGALEVEGRAPPHSVVQLASPEGDHAQAVTDAKGAWRLRLPPSPRPRLYAVSAIATGRALHAEGALLLAPGALSPAVTLRAGAAALPLAPADGRLDIATVDYDPSGVLSAAGHAPPRASVSLSVDGVAAAGGQAGVDGRYSLLAAGRRLAMGPHRLSVAAAGQTASRDVMLAAPASLNTPFAATREAQGWRVEWAPTGGGVQTTLVLAP